MFIEYRIDLENEKIQRITNMRTQKRSKILKKKVQIELELGKEKLLNSSVNTK